MTPLICGMQRRQRHPTPVLLPGKFHGRRSLLGCSLWGREESDTTERLHFHFSLSCIGEGNGNPLQCSCLENPRDRGAWWAANYGVAQSRTRLKRLSSSSSSSICGMQNMTQMNLPMKRKQMHRQRTDWGCQGGGDEGGKDWKFGISRCKLLYTRWINNKVLL